MTLFVPSFYNTWLHQQEKSYVHNGVTGAVLEMAKEDAETVMSGLDPFNAPIASGLLARLLMAGVLRDPATDELDLLRQRYQESQRNNGNLALTVVTSLGCNFACPYCFEDKHTSIMSEAVCDAVSALVKRRAIGGLSSFHVTWFGGEPLLAPSVIARLSADFLRYREEFGFAYSASAITNGYLLSGEILEMLSEAQVTSLQVGLDGPPETHNSMRPLRGGGASFHTILQNIVKASGRFSINIRVNVDHSNIGSMERLFVLLAGAGLAGKVSVNPGQITTTNVSASAPASTYASSCFTKHEYSEVERRFYALAVRYGFPGLVTPTPTGAPCTAVRSNELVIGSAGEVYKCWDSVGDSDSSLGNVTEDFDDLESRARVWLGYDPFEDPECRTCRALPGCMGGCAHQVLTKTPSDNRCSTFRYQYERQLEAMVNPASLAPLSADSGSMVRRLLPLTPVNG